MADLDVLVNVAGIGSTTAAPATPLEVWEDVFAVNARGTFLCCKHAIPGMAARGRWLDREHGFSRRPCRVAQTAPRTAPQRGAVVALTRALAVDHVSDGIRVNAVCARHGRLALGEAPRRAVGESLEALRNRQPMGRLGTP